MKFLRFLFGFLCGVWTLIVATVAFIGGNISGYGLGKVGSEKSSYSGRVSYNTFNRGA